MKGRKRHGGRKANRGTPRETPSLLGRRARRKTRKAKRLEKRWGKMLGAPVRCRGNAVIMFVDSPGGPAKDLTFNWGATTVLYSGQTVPFDAGTSKRHWHVSDESKAAIEAAIMGAICGGDLPVADTESQAAIATRYQIEHDKAWGEIVARRLSEEQGSRILARYAREIEHARARNLPDTAARIEAERAEYQERGS